MLDINHIYVCKMWGSGLICGWKILSYMALQNDRLEILWQNPLTEE